LLLHRHSNLSSFPRQPFVIPAQAGIQQKQKNREADNTLISSRYARFIQSTGFPPAPRFREGDRE